MRVLHVGKFYPPHPGGIERVVETLCQSSRGLVENHVLVANATRETIQEVVDGVQVTRVGTIGAVGSVHIAPAFASWLRRIPADAIVLHEPNPWALLSYAIARPPAPLFVWYHSDVVRPALQYALFYAPMARFVYGRARRIIVSSPALARHAARARAVPGSGAGDSVRHRSGGAGRRRRARRRRRAPSRSCCSRDATSATRGSTCCCARSPRAARAA